MKLLQNELRPETLKDVIGQTHLIGKDKILSNLVKNKRMFNMIMYGPPGIGKTTIARALVNDLEMRYRMLNATINTKKDFEIVFEEAKMYEGIILIVDEIHRMNKDKQDLLLSYLESGLITLIGLTTSNPYHKINPAIRSRCQIIELKGLSKEEVSKGIKKTMTALDNFKPNKKMIDYIATLSNGDLRFAYNLIEFAYYSFGPNFTIENLEEVSTKPSFYMDADEDGHYDTISALQKSIRGSDADAAIHYLGRLLESGDIETIIRRLSVILYEDIGLANLGLGPKAEAAFAAALRLGLPEARIPLAAIVIDMALSPKSNSAYAALARAMEDIENGNIGGVPANIKTNSPLYKYPHDYPNHYIQQQYMPDKIKSRKYYYPCDNKYERALNEFDKIRKKKN